MSGQIKAVASARKSLGEYKAVIVIKEGTKTLRTQVVEKSPERFDVNTKHGVVEGNRYARGTTHESREAAIEVAQREINRLLDRVLQDQEKHVALKGTPSSYIQAQIDMYS